MNKKRRFKFLTIFLILALGLFGFLRFMTYDRNYTWAKEYKEELKTVAEKCGLLIAQTDKIDVEEIKRSTDKTIKIKIQKILGKANIMNYGQEFGETTKIINENKEGFINCKGWCLDDHLIGLEIEHSNIDETTLTTFREKLEKQFDNYKIKWTKL